MAEQGKIVMPTVGATGRRGQRSSKEIYNRSYREFDGRRKASAMMTGHPTGTGLTSNQRPAVCTPSLDLTANPQLGFLSQTKSDNQPHALSNCLGSLPDLMNKHPDSSFHQVKSHSKAAPVQKKTEYQSVFVPHPFTATVLPNQVVGPKTKTGFTEGKERQLYTFKEKSSGPMEPHQIHCSIMRADLVPPPLMQGNERIPGLCSRSCRKSGFTREVVTAPFAWPSSLLPSCQTKSSAPTVKTIGKKEPTGCLRNVQTCQVFPKTPFQSSHFLTDGQLAFFHLDEMKRSSVSHPTEIIGAKRISSYSLRNKDRIIL